MIAIVEWGLIHTVFSSSAVDDLKKFENGPVSLQVVGRTLEEEAVIAMAEIVDKALKDHA